MRSRQLVPGTRLRLEDEGEGWFAGVRELAGFVRGRVNREGDPGSWYLVQLDEPLEVQEVGHSTVSGFRLVKYRQLLVRSRVAGRELDRDAPCSVHVCLIPAGVDPAAHLSALRHPTAWARCLVDDEGVMSERHTSRRVVRRRISPVPRNMCRSRKAEQWCRPPIFVFFEPSSL